MTAALVGQPLRRKEDYALLTGAARFLDDIRLPGMLYAKILRSPHAHARIRSIDVVQARNMPGVQAVLTAADLAGKVQHWGAITKNLPFDDRCALAEDKVIYEGQEVAAVAALTKYQALDALEEIVVDYEELPAVVDPERALAPDAPKIHDFGDGNGWDRYELRIGDMAAAGADLVVSQRFRTNRPGGVPLEPHGAIADFDRATRRLTLYSSTQIVHLVKDLLAMVIGIPTSNIRVIAPAVGAGFGAKGDVFPWEIIAAVLSMRTGRPVHLVLSREEVFRVGGSRCGQVRDSELHVARDGKIVGYRERVVVNSGAVSSWGGQIMRIGSYIGLLPYPIPNVSIDGVTVATNTGPGGPVRGFGVPQAVWAKEQLIDMAAEQLGLDPVEMRLRNIPTSAECPYTTPAGHVVDSSSAHECLQKVAQEIGWAEHRRDREPHIGVGFAVCLKYTSCRHPSIDTDLSSVRVTMGVDGSVRVSSGDVPHGQGHETFLSQIVADILGVDFEQVNVICADTETTPFSLGTFASRAAALVGTAAADAATMVRTRLVEIAAHLLEANPADLDIAGGMAFVRGTPERGIPLASLVAVSTFATHDLPPDVPAGPIEAQATYDTPTERQRSDGGGNWAATYSAAAHAARVRVDPETGEYRLVDYVMAHDSGTVINPLIVEGQHHGGFLHGFGMIFGEDHSYDEHGRLRNTSFSGYQAPTATDVPALHRTFEIPAPSQVIPGGQKGAGETATTPVPAAVGNALYDAIGVRFTSLPITPEEVLLALREKERRGVTSLVWPDMDDGDAQR